MQKSAVYFVLLVLLDIVSIVVSYGSIIEIKGIIAYIIFAVLFVINILLLWKEQWKLFNQLLISFLIFVYLLTGVVFLIREDGRRVIRKTSDGRYTYITYEVNPGAMGHLSYIDNVYYSLIDTDLLNVRIVKSTKHHRYIG
ncbi:MAG: hypothetical protein K2J32_09645 [Ruminococcus sp.]|nr:hypothetical protein [Ruminococcus sp.]